jgi:hypothetical protein
MDDSDELTGTELDRIYDIFEEVLKEIRKPDKKTEIGVNLTNVWKDTTKKFLAEMKAESLEEYMKLTVPLITYSWMWINLLIYTNRAQNEVFKPSIDPKDRIPRFHKLFNEMVQKNLREDMEDLFGFADVFGEMD